MNVENRPAAAAPEFPDPVVTANLYCAGRLDEVLREVVTPFWRELRTRQGGSACHLWTMRYARGGEHLKVRLHGPESAGSAARELLAERAELYFAHLGPPEEAALPAPGVKPPLPIDLEDQAEGGHPDRCLLWTRYRRSAVSFVVEPLLLDDTYVALATLCLGRGFELVLEALEGKPSQGRRLIPLLQALIGGMSAAGFPAELRGPYFAFHRDWLLRSFLVRRGAGPEQAAQLAAQLDRRQAAMGSSLELLRETAHAEWAGGAAEEAAEAMNDADAAWRHALADLLAYLSRFHGNPQYDLDPFAEDLSFPPIFKVFHGFANQLGLGSLDEAFAHHLLLGLSRAPGTAGPAIRLTSEGGAAH